ncbi:hypothetical protein BWI17_14725 [Betaproteobacteria bacterium GR16-43]|nr:hypothetical protein BWI17_14725 [Betaproteobacteria bacterium GR16-43]
MHEALESAVRENAAKPTFLRQREVVSLDDIACTSEDFLRIPAFLGMRNVHVASQRVRKLIAGHGFEAYLAELAPDAGQRELLQSAFVPFSMQHASHSDQFLVHPPAAAHRRESLAGVALALDGMSKENGALFGWPGSQWVSPKPLPADYEAYADYTRDMAVTMLNAGLHPHFIEAAPGDVIVWAGDFVHGSAKPLVPGVARHALMLHYGVRLAH